MQMMASSAGDGSHSVQLAAGRDNFLDAKLAKLGFELSELLRQIILVLAPELGGLDLARLYHKIQSAKRSIQIQHQL